jgi:plasmid stabilization system protein ParE
MTYRIVVEPTAEREIRSIVRWQTENASPAAAARWYDGLLKKIDTLRRHPTRCPLAAEHDKFPEEKLRTDVRQGRPTPAPVPRQFHYPTRRGSHPLSAAHCPR